MKVTAAVRLIAFAEQVSSDMKAREGVAWWDLDPARSILIGDYLIGLMESVEANLTQASMHLTRTRELWTADSVTTSRLMRSADACGQRIPGKPNENESNRRVEASGHVAGFFRAGGSALDNVGGIVVGIFGLKKPIVRASWADLKLSEDVPVGPALEGFGRDLQVAVIDTVRAGLATGPDGWAEWTMDLRYTSFIAHLDSPCASWIHDNQTVT